MSLLPYSDVSEIDSTLLKLPKLPTALRYWDDYLDTYHLIRNLAEDDVWSLKYDGKNINLNFECWPVQHRLLIKLTVVEMLSRLDVATVRIHYHYLEACTKKIDVHLLINLLVGLPPHAVRDFWLTIVKPNVTNGEAKSLKSVLHSLCIQTIGAWMPGLRDYVAKLPTPKQDIYRTVRSGDCFVPLDQQSLIIEYFDESAHMVTTRPHMLTPEDLRDSCLLVISHQYALRPGQIARLKVADFRFHETGAVHFSYPLMKQRRSQNLRRVTRRVKREWGALFEAYRSSARPALIKGLNFTPLDSFFGLTPTDVSTSIEKLVESITGEKWSPTDLRHTAAQRLADSGSAHIALSEFMGHASLRTANVYFDTSPTQAQRVNQALALSPIYSTVAEVAKTRTIDKAALLRLPTDKQIGAVPHGIPIAGIGGCGIGQSLCAKNPVLSCYTCRKFMPLKDSKVHEDVVESIRHVVHDFANASRGNVESPAYTQLRRMLTAATQIIAEIKAGEDETVEPDQVMGDE